MTAADLKRLDELAKDTKDLRDELSRLRNASPVSATNYSSSGVGSGTGDPVAEAACSTADVEEQILRNVLEMVEIIDKIPSEKTRKIFRRRYINQKTWAQIADELGYVSAQGPRKRMKGYKMAVSVPSACPQNGIK